MRNKKWVGVLLVVTALALSLTSWHCGKKHNQANFGPAATFDSAEVGETRIRHEACLQVVNRGDRFANARGDSPVGRFEVVERKLGSVHEFVHEGPRARDRGLTHKSRDCERQARTHSRGDRTQGDKVRRLLSLGTGVAGDANNPVATIG